MNSNNYLNMFLIQVDFKNLAIFPSLIAHKDLTTIQSPNINIKVILEYKVITLRHKVMNYVK